MSYVMKQRFIQSLVILQLLLLILLPSTTLSLDGTESCSSCPSPTHQCIGRSVSDEVCSPCASGKTFWPCNVDNECWCWDTSTPKEPPGDDGPSVCKGCSGPTESCIANANSLIPADDEGCSGCATGQKYWPCDVDGLCWCWDSTKPKKPPAPSSGLEVTTSGLGPCDIFTEAMFMEFAPNSTFPYTYEGFCEAVEDYNLYHEEKVFRMGTETDQRNEIAAFLGNTAHESDDFEAGREYLACADNIEVDGKTYCKPCTNDLFDWETMKCSQSMADLDSPYSEYCQPVFMPPEGCNCETITQVASEGELAGYVDASKVFYGRGAIQLSWNYNYIKASLALTGSPDTFCEDPELVVSDPKYAWGSAIYFWMESEKEGDTCHKEALKHNFGGTLNVINGGLECPAYAGGWHHKAVKMRINRYCHASLLLHLSEIGSMKGCKGMNDSLEECLHDGSCPYCEQMNDGEYIYVDESVEYDEPLFIPHPGGDDETMETEIDDIGFVEDETAATNASSTTGTEIFTTSPTIAKPDTMAPAVSISTNQPSEGLLTPSPSTNPTAAKVMTYPPSATQSEGNVDPTLLPTITSSTSLTSIAPVAISRLLSSSPSGDLSSSPTATILQQATNNTTEAYNATLAPSSASSVLETAQPSPTLTETEAENTIPTWSPTEVETETPSYSPTTPAPTLGPCDGDPCPDTLCRSPWGFCGDGEGYCNEDAVWSPDCPVNSPAPTAPLTSLTTFDINDFIDYDQYDTDTTKPTKEPTLSDEVPKFIKPSGGKKDPPNKKPGLSTSSGESNGKGEVSNNGKGTSTTNGKGPSTLESVSNTPAPTEMPVTESPTPIPVLSPDDPKATYFCGNDWIDANEVCDIRCPSAKSEDCPGDQSCYAFTRCNDTPAPSPAPFSGQKSGEGNSETVVNRPSLVESDAAISKPDSNEAPSVTAQTQADNPGCTGKPCEVAGECRSQFGFCGGSFIYCNDLSSWSIDECGLFGTDENGETLLCGADINECPTGERMVRNPDKNCEFFRCPEQDDTNTSSGGFFVPAPGPSASSLPELPKPTLPTIVDPKKTDFDSVDFSFGSKPSSQAINLDNKPAKEPSQVVVIGNEQDVADDEDQVTDTPDTSSSSSTGSINDPFSNFDSFKYEEWITSARSGVIHVNIHWLCSLGIAVIALITL